MQGLPLLCILKKVEYYIHNVTLASTENTLSLPGPELSRQGDGPPVDYAGLSRVRHMTVVPHG